MNLNQIVEIITSEYAEHGFVTSGVLDGMLRIAAKSAGVTSAEILDALPPILAYVVGDGDEYTQIIEIDEEEFDLVQRDIVRYVQEVVVSPYAYFINPGSVR